VDDQIHIVVVNHTYEEFLDMKLKRFATVMAITVATLVVSVHQADANYTYSTSLTITSVTGTTGTITNTPGTGATFVSTSGTTVGLGDIPMPGLFLPTTPLSANLGNVGVATASPTPDSFVVNYTDTVTVTNPAPGGSSASVMITGFLTLTGIQTVGGAFGGVVTNNYNPPFTAGPAAIGPNLFSGFIGTGATNDFFGPPTIGSSLGTSPSGSLGGVITPAVIPEPASVVMLGLGLLGIGGSLLRRRFRNA
jgi:hypothetical protein